MKERVRAAVHGIDLPPKKAAAILASINLTGPKRRQSVLARKAAVVPPKTKTGRRKGDPDKTATARKPVLLLGKS